MARQTKTARRRAWREWQWCHDDRCDYCLNRIPRVDRAQVDHIRPLNPIYGRAGKDRFDNYALACSKCNNRKQNKSVTEAGMILQLNRGKCPNECQALMRIAGKATQRESTARWRENLKKRTEPCLPI